MNEELEIEIKETLSYPKMSLEKFQSLLNYKRSHIPNKLYKYRDFQSKYHIENFKNDTLWCSSASEFNDPYDSALCFSIGNITRYLIQGQKNEIIELILQEDEHDQSIFLRKIKETIYKSALNMIGSAGSGKSKRKGSLKGILQEVITKEQSRINAWFNSMLQDAYKICSFSERIDSTLMWSHYSDGHKGFAIEYDLTKQELNDTHTRNVWPVIYTNRPFNATNIFESVLENKSVNISYALFATLQKATDWRYEEEWRLCLPPVEPEEKPYAYQMPKPTAIYLGSKIDDSHKNDLIGIAAKKQIKVFKMKINQFEFRMEPE